MKSVHSGHSRSFLFVAFFCTMLLASASEAAYFSVEVTAEIQAIAASNGDITPEAQAVLDELGVAIGGTLTSTYLLDGSAPVDFFVDFGAEVYSYDAVVGGSLSFPAATIPFDSELTSGISFTTDEQEDPFDLVSLVARSVLSSSAGDIVVTSSAALFDDAGEALSGVDLNSLDPSVFSDLSIWDSFADGQRTGLFYTMMFPNSPAIILSAEYTNVAISKVPLPAASWMFAAALGFAGAVANRKRWRAPFQSKN